MKTRTSNGDSVRWMLFDLVMGYHSNIPWCCIITFAGCGNPRTTMKSRTITGRQPWYKLCDKCWKTNYIQDLHICDRKHSLKCRLVWRIALMLRG